MVIVDRPFRLRASLVSGKQTAGTAGTVEKSRFIINNYAKAWIPIFAEGSNSERHAALVTRLVFVAVQIALQPELKVVYFLVS